MIDNSSSEFSSIQNILIEYTERLRKICEKKYDAEIMKRQLIFCFLLLDALAIILIVGFYMFGRQFDFPPYFQMSWYILLTGIIGMIFVTIVRRDKFTDTYDASRISASLEKIVKIASQYNEHCNNKISYKFDFQMRVVDAEETLALYRRIFKKNKFSSMDKGKDNDKNNTNY